MLDQKNNTEKLEIAGHTFESRLLIGTGKFSSTKTLLETIKSSTSEIVTVALRRIDLNGPVQEQELMKALSQAKVLLLPNTAGARTAEDAIKLSHLSRELGGGSWVKLEVTPEPRYLLPDPIETLKATETLVKDGFVVLPYMHADPILALRLQDVGCATVMPLGSPIGSNQGIRTTESIRIIIEQARVPVIVDAGLGAPSHAASAMEMGADAVLVNTAIAISQNPAKSAHAFGLAVLAGRMAYLHGVEGVSGSEGVEGVFSSSPTEEAEEAEEAKTLDNIPMNTDEFDDNGTGKWKAAQASSPTVK